MNCMVDFRERLEYKVYFDKNQSVKGNNNSSSNNNKDGSDETKTKEEKEGAVVSSLAKREAAGQAHRNRNNKNRHNPNAMKKKKEKGKDAGGGVVSSKINDIGWRFDFHCDYWNGWCYCLSTIISRGMVCNSGEYCV